METSPLTCEANQCTGFYRITASVIKELRARGTLSGNTGVTVICISIKLTLRKP